MVMKFGNPVIRTDSGLFPGLFAPPANVYEFLINSWPLSWSAAVLGLLMAAALFVWRWKAPQPKWILTLPLAWFAWQLVSATQTVDAELTRATVLHFAACLVCFWVGLCALSEVSDLRPVWFGLAAGLLVVLWTALDQHFGGLERTRAFALQPLTEFPEEVRAQVAEMRARLDSPAFRAKLASTRVFGTFVYPNALAAGILLLLPATLAGLWGSLRVPWLRWGLPGAMAAGAAGALYWSGSKSGWLIALALVLVALAHARLKPLLKYALLAGLLAAGSLAFFGRHAAYFEKGATSLSARRDYWQAARQMIAARPILGYGPGTFQIPYRTLKPPEAEMAKLAHNDYLQQGCDAGLPSMLAYVGFIVLSVFWLRPRRRGPGAPLDLQRFAVWLGVLGFAVQACVEFGLYIPALAWPFFLFIGWLWGRRGEVSETGSAGILPAA